MLKKISTVGSTNHGGIIRRSEMIKGQQDSGRTASGLFTTASTPLVDRMAPRPFSPFYEETNLNLPRERNELNAWARHYYDTDPLIGNCIDLHSTYPLSTFGVRCPESKEIENFFNKMLERLSFETLIYEIAHEYWIIGEVFPHCELDSRTGEWAHIFIHNPDYIEVRKHLLTSPIITMKPDAELQKIVHSADPESIQIKNQLGPEFIQYVVAGKNIPLDYHQVSHIARKSSPYNVRGTSILTRVYKDLMYRDILREAQFCLAEGTEVLTDRGFIDFRNMTTNDKIATVVKETGELQYHKPKAIHSFDYEGDMYHFKTRQVDCVVTPNHRMVVQDYAGRYFFERADQVKKTRKFMASANSWNEGAETATIEMLGKDIPAETFMEFAGYFISEGSTYHNPKLRTGFKTLIGQRLTSKSYDKIKDCINSIPFNFKAYTNDSIRDIVNSSGSYHYEASDTNWVCQNKDLMNYMAENFGKGSFNKFIPQWLMEYSPRLLKILLDALVAGDGCTRQRKSKDKRYITYSSVSQKLADNVQEIAFKCGYSPSISTWISREGTTIYSVKWSDRKIKTYGINDDKRYPNNKSITIEHYKGKVWCPEVENGVFVSRYNGKISIHGNTIAANHVTPIKVVKVGAADGSYRPGTDELLAVRDMLEQATYDTNFTIVTHTGFELQYIGATGQILPLDSEFDHIEDRILTGLFTSKAFTHGEGPCYSIDTETLTENGWKLYDDIADDEKIACFDTKTSEIKYMLPKKRHKWKFKGNMHNFNTQRIDVSVTPDHRMFVMRNGVWIKVDSQDVKLNDKFLCHAEWNDGDLPDYFDICGKQIKAKTWMEFLGYWISEGSMIYKPKRTTKSTTYQIRISQSQEKNPEKCIEIRNILTELGFNFSYSGHDFIICSKELCEFIISDMGGITRSKDKHIPRKYLNLSKSLLKNILKTLMSGDGNIRMQGKNKDKAYFTYTTISNQLADDVHELAFKCGFSPDKKWDNHGGKNGIWRVRWGENKEKLTYPGLTRKQCFSQTPYDDYVWCFEVPTEAFITRRNGKIGQHFNTYANASVALEVLQQRYVSFRGMIEKWLERKVFAPISRVQDFTKYRNGISELIIPKVNWQRINLKNNREYQGSLEGLVRDNKASLHSLYEALDLDYTTEIKNIKTEIDDAKEIAWKLQTPYLGKENINVSTPLADEMQAAQQAKGPDEGGGAPDLGGGGGMEEMGGGEGGGDTGGLGDMGGGGEAGGMGGAPTGGAPAGGGGEAAPV